MSNDQKDLWNKLAKKNSKYFIFTDKGKKITEDEFRASGQADYKKYITDDPLVEKGKMIALEIGCGIGRMTEFFVNDFNYVIGTDISGEMIAQGKERLKHIKNRLLLEETDGYTLPYNSNTVDFAFSYIVFQHFKNEFMIKNNFAEVARILKPGGMFKVRVRTDKNYKMTTWWAGVEFNELWIEGLQLIKKEPVSNYGLWLWLKK